MVKFVNMTPHPVTIYDEEGKDIIMEIPPSGEVVRVNTRYTYVGHIDDIPIYRVEFTDVDLPPQKPNVVYIVSSVVISYIKEKGINRNDFVAPDSGNAVRDEEGRIKGVKGFITV